MAGLSPTQRDLSASFRDDLLPPMERLVVSFLRFATKIEHDPETGCWNWMGARDKHGYGRWGSPNRKVWFTHRFQYLASGGEIPEGYVLDHLCRNTSCCNPDHLEPVTQAENLRRGTRWPA